MNTSLPVVAAIVLNWNGAVDTVRAIRSLEASAYPELRIVLVDNGSAFGDLAAIKASCPGVRVVELAANHGFGRAVNLGAAAAFALGAEHLLLFNNDACIPAGVPVIERLVAELTAASDVGATGPVIVYDDERLIVQAAGVVLHPAFPAPRGAAKGLPFSALRTRAPRFDFLQGSCLLVRGAAFVAVGGLDPEYFFFAEDADFTLRMQRAGYRSVLVRDVYARHRKSASIVPGSDNAIYTALRSTLIYLKKHARWYHLPSAAATMVALSLLFAGTRLPVRKRIAARAVVRAWRDFFTGRWGGFAGRWAAGYATPDFTALHDDRVHAVRTPVAIRCDDAGRNVFAESLSA